MRRGILANRDELKALNARIAVHPYDKCYEALRKRCALILESAPITEMNWQSAWESGRYGAALAAARGAQGRILDLSIADGIDPNSAYRSRAVEELMNLVRWSTWVDPARAKLPADRCTAEAAVASVIGLDMLWDFLTADQRQEVLTALRQRVIEPIGKAVANRDIWWYTAVNHWNAVCNSACGLVGLVLGDEDDSAEQVHQLARKGLQHFFNDLGKEGGWDEGIGYWGYATRYVMLFAHASARLIDDQELLHRRGMDETGLFPIYFSPNGHPASFGDNATMPLHGSLYLLDAYFQCPELTWWLDTYSFTHDVNTTDWSQAGLALLFRPESAKPPTEPKLKPMKVFHQIGWGAMADRWPRPKFYAAIKTGDLAASHSQRDMNSLQLQVDGEMLLVDLGNPPEEEGSSYFSDARSEFYEIRARAHNTITIAEEDHQLDAQGAIVDSDSTKNTRWFVCDGNSACSHDVRFFRHVVMLTDKKNQSLVILDELNLGAPENVNLFWHTSGQIELNEKMMLGKITGQRASLHFALGATASAEISMNMHKLDSRRMDHFIQLSSGMIGPNYLISVFSRKAIRSAVEFSGDADNGMKIHFGKTRLTFGPGRKHLVFTGFEYL